MTPEEENKALSSMTPEQLSRVAQGESVQAVLSSHPDPSTTNMPSAEPGVWKQFGVSALQAAAPVIETMDRFSPFWGAGSRAAVGSAMDNYNGVLQPGDQPPQMAYAESPTLGQTLMRDMRPVQAYYDHYGTSDLPAPSSKELAQKAGISGEGLRIPTPYGRSVEALSPAGAVGFAVDSVLPMGYGAALKTVAKLPILSDIVKAGHETLNPEVDQAAIDLANKYGLSDVANQNGVKYPRGTYPSRRAPIGNAAIKAQQDAKGSIAAKQMEITGGATPADVAKSAAAQVKYDANAAAHAEAAATAQQIADAKYATDLANHNAKKATQIIDHADDLTNQKAWLEAQKAMAELHDAGKGTDPKLFVQQALDQHAGEVLDNAVVRYSNALPPETLVVNPKYLDTKLSEVEAQLDRGIRGVGVDVVGVRDANAIKNTVKIMRATLNNATVTYGDLVAAMQEIRPGINNSVSWSRKEVRDIQTALQQAAIETVDQVAGSRTAQALQKANAEITQLHVLPDLVKKDPLTAAKQFMSPDQLQTLKEAQISSIFKVKGGTRTALVMSNKQLQEMSKVMTPQELGDLQSLIETEAKLRGYAVVKEPKGLTPPVPPTPVGPYAKPRPPEVTMTPEQIQAHDELTMLDSRVPWPSEKPAHGTRLGEMTARVLRVFTDLPGASPLINGIRNYAPPITRGVKSVYTNFGQPQQGAQ